MSTSQLGLSIGLALAFPVAKVLGKSCRMPRTKLAMRTKSEGRERFWKTLDAVGEDR